MVDIDYFRAIQNGTGLNSNAEAKVRDAKERLKRELASSVNYVYDAKRNDVLQPMVITSSDVMYKCDVEALPDDELYPGDMVDAIDHKWVVVQTKRTNPFQILGTGWMCNYEFRFQNGASQIMSYWGVMDSGVYSTTKTGDSALQTEDKQFKIYLPLNADTEKIYVDKRLAVGTKFNYKGEEIIDVYQVTGRNVVARSYGTGAHLLILEVRSAEYSPTNDSLEYMVCDYVQPESPQPAPTPANRCFISGRSKVYAGSKREYIASFYDASGEPVTGVDAVWTTPAVDGVSFLPDGNKLTVSAKDTDDVVGASFDITAQDAMGAYTSCTLSLEVCAVG